MKGFFRCGGKSWIFDDLLWVFFFCSNSCGVLPLTYLRLKKKMYEWKLHTGINWTVLANNTW